MNAYIHNNKDAAISACTTNQTFSQRLQHIMLIRHRQNIELALQLYLSPSTISGYRTGHRTPGIEQIAGLCRELNVSADYLLGLSDDDSVHIYPPPQ